MTQQAIELKEVSKSYRRGEETIKVLHSVSLSVETGEFLALMGPSGSGKTTLLNLIAGLDAPDSGTIKVFDKTIHDLKEAALARWRASSIGFVFQFYNLIPVLTALENVALPLSLLPMSRSERDDRAKYALGIVGLSDRLKHFPGQLSGGQEQRVAIARAIVTDPQLIVADEPTGDLDRQSASEIMGLMERLNRELQKTIVIVTHDQAAARHAKRMIHLEKGDIVD